MQTFTRFSCRIEHTLAGPSRTKLRSSPQFTATRCYSDRSSDAIRANVRSKWGSPTPQAPSGSGLKELIHRLPKRHNDGQSPDAHSRTRIPKNSQILSDLPPSASTSEFARTTLVPQTILAHKAAMKKSFPDGWNPPKKLSREAMDGLRTLHNHDPETFTTTALATRFKISPEAVRRILKSRWQPDGSRLAKIAEKEAQARKAMIERRKTGVGKTPEPVPSDDPVDSIPAMFMDEESDRLLERGS